MRAPATGVPATRTPRITRCPRTPPSRIAAPHRRGRAGPGVRRAPVAPGRARVRPADVRPPAAARVGERRAGASPERPAAVTADRPGAAAPGAPQDGAGRTGPAPVAAAGPVRAAHEVQERHRHGAPARAPVRRVAPARPVRAPDGPRSGPARTGAPRTGASRSGAPRSAAPRSASSRSGAAGSGPPRRTGTSRDAGARARPGTDRPARRDRRAAAPATQGRRLGQRRPPRRTPGQPA